MAIADGIPFFKLSGAGNDFIAVVLEADDPPPTSQQVRAWCRRGVSLGADGVFTLQRASAGARMVHWNADGSRAELCLNGSRAAIHLVGELGWTGDSSRAQLETDVGVLDGRCLGNSRAEVSLPESLAPRGRALDSSIRRRHLDLGDGHHVEGDSLVVGVPHLVVSHQVLQNTSIDRLGPSLRHHPALGPTGANVDFVDWRSNDGNRSTLALRTWERGVEAETLACGTGVIAVALTGLARGRLRLPTTAITASGFELTVDRRPDGRLTLAGDARVVARGELLAEAEIVPAGGS